MDPSKYFTTLFLFDPFYFVVLFLLLFLLLVIIIIIVIFIIIIVVIIIIITITIIIFLRSFGMLREEKAKKTIPGLNSVHL